MSNWAKVLLSLIVGILCLGMPVMPSASAGSLWSDTSVNMFVDRKAHMVGDILTVIITENSTTSRVGKADNTKTSNTNIDAGAGIFSSIKNATAGNSDNFQAKGSITNSNSTNAKITAQVIDVQPNGNLVIYGTQTIRQNGEDQKITISGIVRVEDVAANNTVLSSLISNAQIKVDGDGPIADKQRQGMLSQIFNFLF